MNENKKLMIIGIILLVIIALVPITAIITNKMSEKIYNKFRNTMDSKKLQLVYIGRDDCSYCNLFDPEIKLISEEFDIDYLYINTNELKETHYTKILEDLEIDINNFGTPHIAVTKDGKKVAEQSGYVSEDKLFEFLKTQGLIDKEEKLALNYINYGQYSQLISSTGKELIVIAQSGCNACLSMRPIFYKVAKEYDVKINYLNVAMLDQESATAFQSSLDYFAQNSISTPTMLVVSNKKVVDSLAGAVDEEKFVSFLKTNGFIKE